MDPRKTSVPCRVQWVVTKHRALNAPAIEGSQQGQITKKGIRLDFLFEGVQRFANQAMGLLATNIVGSPLQSQLLRLKVLAERNLISHDVIANPRQFIAERFSSKASIFLGHFTVVVTSEALIVPA